tara:strand:+ start:832 stop:1656 length:825 start_codon:yes stop_codon:yes gene_type:complete
MTIPLRDYQSEAVECVIKHFHNNYKKQLVVLPTGAGKTIVMAEIARRLNLRTLLIAHREELINQAKEKFQMAWPEGNYGICRASQDELDKRVVFGSVQSLIQNKRLEKAENQNFDLLLIDEAHHANSPSYQKIIERLGFHSTAGNKLLVGVTATPMRSDNKEIGEVFEQVSYSTSIANLIQLGYLCPVKGRRIVTTTTLNKVHSSKQDFYTGELSEAVNTPERNQLIVDSYLKYAQDRKGIVFCCDVQHCKDLSEAFKRAQIRSTAVFGDMVYR